MGTHEQKREKGVDSGKAAQTVKAPDPNTQLGLFNSAERRTEEGFYPAGINAVRVRDWLARFYELERIRGMAADLAWMIACHRGAVSIPVNT